MATISGFQPALQPNPGPFFTLPFNEMYTALEGRQNRFDVAQDKQDALFTALGGISNLLPEDAIIHQQKLTDLYAKEQQLRDSVGGDLSNPQYDSGLRKLIVGSATDPFYPTAMNNYDVVTKDYYPQYQKFVAENGYEPEPWQVLGSDINNYTGAINPDGSLNKIGFKGIESQLNYFGKVAEMIKEIKPEKYADVQWDDRGFYVNRSGERITVDEIISDINANKHALESTPDYKQLKRRFDYANPGGDFNKYLQEGHKGLAGLFDKNDVSSTYAFRPDTGSDGSSGGRGTTNSGKILKPEGFLSIQATYGSPSIGFKSPEAANKYIVDINKQIANLKTKEGGLSDLQNKLTLDNGNRVTVDPIYDASNERFDFNISAFDKDGNLITLDQNSDLYKKNAQHILTLKAEYEYLNISKDRAEELDMFIKEKSGYDPRNKNFTDEDVAELANKKYYELIKRYNPQIKTLTQLHRGTGENKPLQDLLGSITKEANDMAQEELGKGVPGYKEYRELYEQSYGEGYLLTNEYGNSFGVDERSKQFREEAYSQLTAALTKTRDDKNYRGIAVFDPVLGRELNRDEYNDFAEDILSKEEQGLNTIKSVNWRLDQGGDGLVVDFTLNGKTVEFRDISGVVEYLTTPDDKGRVYQDLAVLKLMDSASHSMSRPSSAEGVGQGGDFGFFGDGVSFPKRMFKRNALPVVHNGKTYPAGSFEYKDASGNKQYFENMYDMTIEGYIKEYNDIQLNASEGLIDRVIQAESNGNPDAVSPKGAIGLMQILQRDGALDDWNKENPDSRFDVSDLTNPEINKQIGTWYLNTRIPTLLNTNNIPDTPENRLIAYNYGIGNMKAWYKNTGGIFSRLPKETRDYVTKILGNA